MDETDLRLDGNAAAGALVEVFARDVTAAVGSCGYCGASAALAAAHLYPHAPGLVLRCGACEGVILRLVRARDRLLLDLAGLTRLELDGREVP